MQTLCVSSLRVSVFVAPLKPHRARTGSMISSHSQNKFWLLALTKINVAT